MYSGHNYHHYENGVLHRLDGPAIYNKENTAYHYFINGQRTRVDGPAEYYTNYPVDGELKPNFRYYEKTVYCFENKIHKTNGPAMIQRSTSIINNILYESYSEGYFLDGKRSKLDGPASIFIEKRTNQNTSEVKIEKREHWYYNDERYGINDLNYKYSQKQFIKDLNKEWMK